MSIQIKLPDGALRLYYPEPGASTVHALQFALGDSYVAGAKLITATDGKKPTPCIGLLAYLLGLGAGACHSAMIWSRRCLDR